MTYKEWMNEVNRIANEHHVAFVRNKVTWKAYREGISPRQHVETTLKVKKNG